MKPLPLAAVCLGLALLTFFGYPGHTWLQQDTQIYVPILEHDRDPAVLRNDLLVQDPHVAFTLYDEVARGLRAVSGQGFREVLQAQQIVTRALAIWGFYLLATALGLSSGAALLVAAFCALGATITGPQVLSFEYEPTPRAFAVPLLFCAMGLAAHRRYLGASLAAAAAFLYHPPTALPFWGLFLLLWWGRRFRLLLLAPLAVAAVILALAAHGEGGQAFFGQLTPWQEQLQRMRAPYAWISTWHAAWIVQYCLLCLIGIAAFLRLRRKMTLEIEVFLLGLPLLGMLSMPLSWLLLERAKWVLMPQVQPLRLLLFVTVAAQFLSAAAGARAAMSRRWLPAAGWLAMAYLIATQPVFTERPQPVWPPLRVAYPALHTAALDQLSAWARASTPSDAVFLFPDAGHGLASGIFRADALRAIFVDWKSGGQVNYRKDFAEQWWARWQLAKNGPIDLPRYEAFGISYIVLKPEHRLLQPAAYQNAAYVVYAVQHSR
ncbi:MAG TPA: DUF6798 domain-containing protein [Candidatus Sulfopaludibacter sp.]|jgi:hypothetical protein|nr:DUF6798 domain-containing protein [Candidatus Sulfopaludibacter sp.]